MLTRKLTGWQKNKDHFTLTCALCKKRPARGSHQICSHCHHLYLARQRRSKAHLYLPPNLSK